MTTSEGSPAPQAVTRMLLDLAHLPATEAEVNGLASGLPMQRAMADALYAVEAACQVHPVLVFRPENGTRAQEDEQG
jgi:hypothetical protein